MRIGQLKPIPCSHSHVMLLSLLCILIPSCKGPTDPGPEPINYRSYVEVTYTRDESKITNPSADATTVRFYAVIFDPKRPVSPTGNYPSVSISATSETGVFKATLSKVYRHTKDYAQKHEIRVSDLSMLRFDEGGIALAGSSTTGENITIPNAYDLKIVQESTFGTKLRFKMR
ncbi:hypothetical protein ACFLR7_06130 [Acidobacteriota bacterium]